VITIIGILVIIGGLICWVGQSLAVFALPTAVRFGLFEPEGQIDSSICLFERFSQGIMDVLLAWILPLAGLLMILENQYWPILALVGGGVYLYLPGVFMITRIIWKRNGRKVGKPSSVRAAYIFGTIWIMLAVIMITLAIVELKSRGAG
jgi:hypothetical protein